VVRSSSGTTLSGDCYSWAIGVSPVPIACHGRLYLCPLPGAFSRGGMLGATCSLAGVSSGSFLVSCRFAQYRCARVFSARCLFPDTFVDMLLRSLAISVCVIERPGRAVLLACCCCPACAASHCPARSSAAEVPAFALCWVFSSGCPRASIARLYLFCLSSFAFLLGVVLILCVRNPCQGAPRGSHSGSLVSVMGTCAFHCLCVSMPSSVWPPGRGVLFVGSGALCRGAWRHGFALRWRGSSVLQSSQSFQAAVFLLGCSVDLRPAPSFACLPLAGSCFRERVSPLCPLCGDHPSVSDPPSRQLFCATPFAGSASVFAGPRWRQVSLVALLAGMFVRWYSGRAPGVWWGPLWFGILWDAPWRDCICMG